MSTATTAQDIGRLQADIRTAKHELGKMSNEREIGGLTMLMERVAGLLECLDERMRGLEVELKRLSGDGK